MGERTIDSEDIWRRVGLDQLRQALVSTQNLAESFEQSLRALPPCNACARVSLLEQIRTTGGRLSGEVTSLSVLADTLKQAVAAAEKTQIDLIANAPYPCQCSKGQCTCHD